MRSLPIIAFVLIATAAAPVAAAQLYRWIDDKGRVEWRDTPPPADAKNVEQRTMVGNTIQTSNLPYSVQQAVKNHPVTLWAYDCGEPCTEARGYLARRGVPHAERNAQKERDALHKATGSFDVPVLVVGTRTLKGFLSSDWDEALDKAGYPRTPPPGAKPQAQAAAKPDAPKAAPKTEAPKPDAQKPAARQP